MNEKSDSRDDQQHQGWKRVDKEWKGDREAAEGNPFEEVRHDPVGSTGTFSGKKEKENDKRTDKGKQYRAGTNHRGELLRNTIKP